VEYFLTEEQLMIRELAAQIAKEKVKPVRTELDEKGEFPWGPIKAMAESDLFAVFVPEEYGGLGGGIFELCLVLEELSRVCLGTSTSYAASGLGAMPIMLGGSDDLKGRYLPQIASGEKLGAYALTEPSAGSDAAGIRTTAVKDGDHWVLNGTKQWITNGGVAGIYSVIAITDREKGARGATFFVVEDGDPGFTYGKKEDKMGLRCSVTGELIFTDCRIPEDRIIGREGMGFILAMRTFDKTRPGIGAKAVGLCQGALDVAVEYARQRVQFGKPIIAFQAVQHMLADMATLTEASRALVYAVCRHIDSGEKNISKYSAISKVFASDAAMKVATDAVQVLGGYGYMKDYPVEKMMRDAKILQIYEGTNQIQRNIIGQELNKEYGRIKESFL
jgi:butyryl-CoA dehydrogenase